MVFKLVLLCNLLLTSVVLADSPPTRRVAHHDRLRGDHHSQGPNSYNSSPAEDDSIVECSNNWSGAILDATNGTFTSVTGTFTVPTASGPDGSGLSLLVGIDGRECSTTFEAGIDVVINGTDVSYNPWFEWYPDPPQYITGFGISYGDLIVATVMANSTQNGVGILQNKNTGQVIQQEINSTSALCMQSAEWILEDASVEIGGSLVPFAKFDSVVFTDNVATTANGTTYTPASAILSDIQRNGTIITDATASGDNITITYIADQ